MCADFSELAHHLAVMHAHITHISRLTAEMATCVESRAGKRLALDLSNAALQVSINGEGTRCRGAHNTADRGRLDLARRRSRLEA
jgi:hypothetical protein